MCGYIIGTLHRMAIAGITKIVVKTITSACDIIFYHLVCYHAGGLNIIKVAAN